MISKRMKLGLLLATSLTVTTANADLDDTLDEMFSNTSVLPTISQNAKQHVVSGGYIRLRAPNKRFSVVSFNPPRISAGCGGIDFYGGSFSFINAEEFRALLRQIGSQAIGYAFNIALSAICGDCMSIMNDLQKKIASMNKVLSDTCALAKGISFKAASSLEGKWDDLDTALQKKQTDEGVFTDLQDAFTSFGDLGGSSTDVNQEKCASENEECKSNPASAENNAAGNQTAKAFFGDATQPIIQGVDSETASTLALNVLGMKTMASEDPSQAAEVHVYPPRIRYEHLRTGGNLLDIEGGKYQIWECPVKESDYPNQICLHPELSDWQYAGAKEYVLSRLLGEKNGDTRTGVAPNGGVPIVKAFSQGNVELIKDDQMNFLFSMGANLYRPLMRVQGNPDHVEKVAVAIAPHMIEAVQIRLGQSIIEEIQRKIKNSPHLELDEDQVNAFRGFIEQHTKVKYMFEASAAERYREIDGLIVSLKRGY